MKENCIHYFMKLIFLFLNFIIIVRPFKLFLKTGNGCIFKKPFEHRYQSKIRTDIENKIHDQPVNGTHTRITRHRAVVGICYDLLGHPSKIWEMRCSIRRGKI